MTKGSVLQLRTSSPFFSSGHTCIIINKH